jgi:hypothetical protein
MTDKNHIDGNGLEELLRSYSLNEEVSGSLAEAVLSQEYEVPVNKAKERAMLNRLNRDINGPGHSRFIYGGILGLLILAVLMYLLLPSGKKDSATAHAGVKPATGDARRAGDPGAAGIEATSVSDTIHVSRADTFGSRSFAINRLYTLVSKDSTQAIPEIKVPGSAATPAIALPYLSEADRLRYKKIKQQMLERLTGSDKGLYTYILANKTEYTGKPTVIDAFTIRNVAVTNLEYKTFLADLIMQERGTEYFKAEVLALKWKQQGYEKLAYDYFQEDKYNDFPVVNVTENGARLFCKWLNEELKRYMQQNKLKEKKLLIRLPYDKEWILAARDGYAKISYETGYNTIYEPREGLVDFSFVKRMHQIRKKAMGKDTLYPLYITNRYGWPEQQLTGFLAKGFSAYNYAPADTIYPDRMKVYGKIGHLSEMVPQYNTSRIWLSGLTWKTKEEYDAFESAFKTAGASPFVTFRFVVIDAQDAEYKDPFW